MPSLKAELYELVHDITDAINTLDEDNPSANLYLLERLQAMQRTIEGPAGYISRVRLQVRKWNCPISSPGGSD